IFDKTIWNDGVFDKYRETVPMVRTNALLTSGAFRHRADWAGLFPEQAGGNKATIPYTGILDGEADNYDGVTNMSLDGVDTFMQDIAVIGRMKGWQEKDFTYAISGKDFMPEIAKQVTAWYDNVNIGDILAILDGVFGMSGALNADFVTSHTFDISANAGELAKFNETTTIEASQRACGQNMNVFSIAYMHSAVVAGLQKKAIVEYAKRQSGRAGLEFTFSDNGSGSR
ncbi:MAG: phage coat protein, partial [Oscillospiraceae bacterium]|nr:phage coat protein [Oscillospiraceae bacterium]